MSTIPSFDDLYHELRAATSNTINYDLTKAFKRLSPKYHPDKCAGDDELWNMFRSAAERLMTELFDREMKDSRTKDFADFEIVVERLKETLMPLSLAQEYDSLVKNYRLKAITHVNEMAKASLSGDNPRIDEDAAQRTKEEIKRAKKKAKQAAKKAQRVEQKKIDSMAQGNAGQKRDRTSDDEREQEERRKEEQKSQKEANKSTKVERDTKRRRDSANLHVSDLPDLTWNRVQNETTEDVVLHRQELNPQNSTETSPEKQRTKHKQKQSGNKSEEGLPKPFAKVLAELQNWPYPHKDVSQGIFPTGTQFLTQKEIMGQNYKPLGCIYVDEDNVTNIFLHEIREPLFFDRDIVCFASSAKRIKALKTHKGPVSIYIKPISQKGWILYGSATVSLFYEAPTEFDYVTSKDKTDEKTNGKSRPRKYMVRLQYSSKNFSYRATEEI